MAYNKSGNESAKRYVKEKQHSILLRFKKETFETDIKPYIDKSGLPVVTFIKQAIKEKIEREK